MQDPIILEGLSKSYGGFLALDNLDMRVKKNSFTGFLGPNGAGKSTTLKILANLISATSGSAYLNGIDVTKDFKGALADVGMVVETPEFYPYLTPRETFRYIGELNGMSRESIHSRGEEMLEKLKMSANADKRIGEFSKGMKQRIALGQALLKEPSMIILDEPTSGLDPRGMVEIREILKGLRSEGLTVLMSSHLMQEVSELCDHVVIIEKGRKIADGDVGRLLNGDGGRRVVVRTTRDMAAETVAAIASRDGVRAVTPTSSRTLQISIEGGEVEQAELLSFLAGSGSGVYHVSSEDGSLEKLYMELVQDSR